jgi:hypothetical protein
MREMKGQIYLVRDFESYPAALVGNRAARLRPRTPGGPAVASMFQRRDQSWPSESVKLVTDLGSAPSS